MSIPQLMRAVQIKEGKGPPSSLYIDDNTPVPTLEGPKERQEILIKVIAFGLNRMDLMQRTGGYPLPPGTSPIMGVEFSGTVVEPVDSDFVKGDEVLGLATGGAYAEYIKVPAKMVLHKPKELTWEQAAAIPENFLTAFQALTLLSDTKRGDDILIHAGASGVGLAAIQIARDIGVNKIYITAGSEKKIQFCQSIGADKGINYKKTDWAEELSKLTDGKGVDVIMDFIGSTYFVSNLNSLARDGRLVIQGLMGGAVVKEVNISAILFKRIRIQGSALRSRSLEYQSDLVQKFVQFGGIEKIVEGVKREKAGDQGHHLAISQVYSWRQIKEAHEEMESNQNLGKIIVKID